ncbi:MAG: DoxX family protein [Deltaproteobacteria bacterium]|nr:DoxX family protein [Deltaproteobacteria bacterium]
MSSSAKKTAKPASKKIPTFAAQAIAGLIMLAAAYMKFSDDPASIALFKLLDMDPFGRHLIAVIELLAGLLLLSPYSALGSVATVAVLLGAMIAHATKLGVVIDGDGGKLFMVLLLGFVSAVFVMISRREEIPLVGETL